MVTEFRPTGLRRSLEGLRRYLSRVALAAAVALPPQLPATVWAQTPVSKPSSLSTEIEAKLKQRGTLILRDATLIETLFAIKENWDINIVVDNDVRGAINGAYTNAPLHEILDSILLPHGYGYRAVGDSLVVLKLNDIGAMKPLFSTQMLPLSHVPPEEVLKVIELMLSPHGKAHAVPSSKSLVVMDYPDRIDLIKERIRELDVAAAQVDAGVPVSEMENTSPVTTGARSLLDMLMGGGSATSPDGTAADPLGSANGDPTVAPDATSGTQRGPTAPLANPPAREAPAQRIVDNSPSDQTATASSAAEPQEDTGPKLDVAFFTPQYIRAPAITEALGKLVSEYGQISVIAEENRIVAIDQPEYLKRITAAIERLDVPRSQVRIAAMIYDCSLEDTERLGINWSHTIKGSNVDASGNAQDSIKLNSVTLTPPSPDAVNGALTLTSLGRHFDVSNVIHALNSSSSSKLLADPTVVVLDQESAKIAIVTEIPYQQLTESALGGSIGTTAFREAGVTLEVTPRIARDGTINLIVTPQFSVLTGFTETDNQPIIARREATTTVRVSDGQTLVIGGLRQKSAVRDRSGIPYLSDLKFVGHLFRYRSDEMRESELLVFITPIVITPQTFGTIREQQAYDNGVCQLHGVRQCLECCNQERDRAVYENQDFGYGSVIYEVPAANPHQPAVPTAPAAPESAPPLTSPPVDPQVTSGPRAQAISYPHHPAYSSRRDPQAAGPVTRATPPHARPAGPTTATRNAPQAAPVPRVTPVPTTVSQPVRVSMTDEPEPHRVRPVVQGPVIDFTAAESAAPPQAPMPAAAVPPATNPERQSTQRRTTRASTHRSATSRRTATPRMAARPTTTVRTTPPAAAQPVEATSPPAESSSGLKGYFR